MERERGKRGPTARATIRRLPPEPPRFPLPGAAEAEELSLDEIEVEVPDESRVARRRASSAPAHEVQMEELEMLGAPSVNARVALAALSRAPTLPPALPKRSASVHELPRASLPPPAPPPRASRPSAPLHPMTSLPLDATIRVVRRPASPGRRAALAVIGASLLAGGFALGVLAHRSHVQPAPVPVVSAPPMKLEPAASVPASPSSIPVVPVASLPRPTVGTVLGIEGHRLWIDGKLTDAWKAIVACGGHSVQVGSAGTLRKVDVPCGDSIVVPP